MKSASHLSFNYLFMFHKRQRIISFYVKVIGLQNILENIGGSKGQGGREVHPTLGPNSFIFVFIFMQFWGKIGQNNRLTPPS